MTPDLSSIRFRAGIDMDGEEISGWAEVFGDRREGIQLTSEDAETIRRIVLKAAIPVLRSKICEAQGYAASETTRRQQQIDTLSAVIVARRQEN